MYLTEEEKVRAKTNIEENQTINILPLIKSKIIMTINFFLKSVGFVTVKPNSSCGSAQQLLEQ